MGARSRRGLRAIVAIAMLVALLSACDGGTSGLVGPTWQWTYLTEFAPLAHSPISDSSRYTMTLADDGTFNLTADCNSVSGTYVTDGDEITMSFGPSTLVACPEGSLGDQFVSLLHTVHTFSVDGDELTLHLEDAAGKMVFDDAGSASA